MQKTGREGSALKSPAAWIRFLGIIVGGTGADLLSKSWAQGAYNTQPPFKQARYLEPYFLDQIEFIWQPNRGAVFGMGQGRIAFFIIFTLGAIGLLTWLFADSRRKQYCLQSLLALILAGALGNLYDRIKYEHVRDFLRFTIRADWAPWRDDAGHFWPYVFNVADIFITVGVVGLMVVWVSAMIRHRRGRSSEKAENT